MLAPAPARTACIRPAPPRLLTVDTAASGCQHHRRSRARTPAASPHGGTILDTGPPPARPRSPPCRSCRHWTPPPSPRARPQRSPTRRRGPWPRRSWPGPGGGSRARPLLVVDPRPQPARHGRDRHGRRHAGPRRPDPHRHRRLTATRWLPPRRARCPASPAASRRACRRAGRGRPRRRRRRGRAGRRRTSVTPPSAQFASRSASGLPSSATTRGVAAAAGRAPASACRARDPRDHVVVARRGDPAVGRAGDPREGLVRARRRRSAPARRRAPAWARPSSAPKRTYSPA